MFIMEPEIIIMFSFVNVAYVETLTNKLNIFYEQKVELL